MAAPRASLEVQCSHAAARRALFGDVIPVTVGRYRITGRMGLGGMGIVYAARDPQLRRDVAVKVVQPGRLQADPAAGRAQLMTEARSLARVSSPHVVTVLDVGLHGEQVYLAMELAEGPTLDVWLAQEERSIPEILAVFKSAAQGLVDAHALGVVHGDFKPANVVVTTDRDGYTTRLIDFGLASLDRTGPSGGVGTPAYMAPEIRGGQRATAASDQYSFCVALAEAVDGRRAPLFIRRVLRRGLAERPEHRWSSMLALRDALSNPRSGWTTGSLVLLVAVSLMGGVAWALGDTTDSVPACPPDRSAEVWPPSAAVEESFPPAVREHLAEQVEDWRSSWSQACELRTADARTCLDRQLDRLSTLLEAPSSQREAPTWSMAVARLDPPQRCLEVQGEVLGDPDVVRAVDRADARVTSDPEPTAGQAEAAAALERAQTSDPVSEADAMVVMGRLWAKQGRLDDAAAAFERAALIAQRWHRDRLTAAAWCERASLELEIRADYDAGAQWLRHAESAVDRAHRPPDLVARVDRLAGLFALRTGGHEEAGRRFDRSMAALSQWYGEEHVALAAAHHDLGSNYAELRQLDRARPHLEWARQRWEREFGAEHPLVALAWSSLGAVAEYDADYDGALDAYAKALSILEERPSDPKFAVTSFNLGNVLYRVGRYDEATARFEQAAQRWTALNPDHPNLGHVQLGLGNIARDEKRWEQATLHFDAAADAWRRALGSEHMLVAMALGAAAEARLARGDIEQAEADLRESIEIRERQRGADEPSLAYPLTTLGSLLRQAERLDEADGVLRRALDLRSAQSNIDRRLLAETRFALAKLRRAQGRHDEARTLGLTARDDFDGPWPYAGDDVAMVQRWLDAR